MNTIKLSNTDFHVPAVAAGCMRINCLDEKALSSYIEGCIELGINFFDHADIYAGGECEKLFGQALSNMNINREDIVLQSKCGIIPGVMYDFS